MIIALLWGKILWAVLSVKECVVLTVSAAIATLPALYLLLTDRQRLFSLYESYQYFSALPMGTILFSSLVGMYAPYSSSVTPTVTSLTMSDKAITCIVTMEDRPWLRNPFQSLHAVALTNIGECASGIAIVSILQDKRFRGLKGIPTRIDTEYFKKGRGQITATAAILFADLKDGLVKFETSITNSSGELVATCFVTWSFRSSKSDSKEKKLK